MSTILDGWKGITLNWDARTLKRMFSLHTVVMRKRAVAVTAAERAYRYTPSAWGWVCKCGEIYVDYQGLGWGVTLGAANRHLKGIE